MSGSELDEEILRFIARHAAVGSTQLDEAQFNDLALRIFAYQVESNAPYARYCASLGLSSAEAPRHWREIPAVPAEAFKEATLATFAVAQAALVFQTSGTTHGNPGVHYLETRDLYDASLLAGFAHFVLPDKAGLRYLNLVPNPAQRKHSSLGYMMARVSANFGDEETGWYLDGETILLEAFLADVQDAISRSQAVCIATTAFALAEILEILVERDLRLPLPAGSRMMETGGFKGRTRAIDPNELYARTQAVFSLPAAQIIAEYGMTELTSQYYDDVRARDNTTLPRVKRALPWLRSRVVDAQGRELPEGNAGALVHVDLCNRSSCLAILTQDLGEIVDAGIRLLGRESEAPSRGCSLDAETLAQRR